MRTEDDEHRSQEQQASTERENGPENRNATIEEEVDITGAVIPVDDHVPGESMTQTTLVWILALCTIT